MLPVANSSLGPKAKQSIGVEEVAGWWQGRRKRINKDQLQAVSKPWLSRRLVIADITGKRSPSLARQCPRGCRHVLNSKPFHVAIESGWFWSTSNFVCDATWRFLRVAWWTCGHQSTFVEVCIRNLWLMDGPHRLALSDQKTQKQQQLLTLRHLRLWGSPGSWSRWGLPTGRYNAVTWVAVVFSFSVLATWSRILSR